MVQIKSATQVTDKAIGDIFQMECVREISKERLRHDSPFDVILPAGKSEHYYVFLYSGMLAEGTSRRIACSEFGDWICETYFGWMILTDEEYKEARG